MKKICISYVFNQSLVTKCLVPSSIQQAAICKLILHYKNILVSTSFEHARVAQYKLQMNSRNYCC